jgi:hypothetical protein
MSKFLEDSYVTPCIKRGCMEAKSINLPDGTYNVNGGGYSFQIEGIEYEYTIITNDGVRGMYQESITLDKGDIVKMPMNMTIYKIMSNDISHIREQKIDTIVS